MIDWARGQGFGLSRLVSLGNQADIRETDVLAPVAEDPHTKVITLYLEGVSDGRRFIKEARSVTRIKPVIALKVGRYSSGQRAVASHTGALAGMEAAFNAAFRRAGVIRADSNEEMFDWARALAWCPLPGGSQVAVLTNAGGPGVTATDAIEAHGLSLAKLDPETQTALRGMLPAAASVENPVDMLATATTQQYAGCLRTLLAEPAVDSVLVILPPPPMESAGAIARAIIPIIYSSKKPVLVALMGERMIQEAVEYFRAARVPEYRFPERAVSALATLVGRAESLRLPVEEPERPEGVSPEQVYHALADFKPEYEGFLPQAATDAIITAYGIPTQSMIFAGSVEEIESIAPGLDYPVAMKIDSPDLPHKSDVGGVRLDLQDGQAVLSAYLSMLADVRQLRPEARIEGVQLQKMLPAGQDVIIGTVNDPQFGPLVMFGSGGIEVEGLQDVRFALAPLVESDLEYLLETTWAGRKLRGFRSLKPADRAAVKDVLNRLAQLAVDFPQLGEIEINPLRVLAPGRGAVALDIRIRLKHQHLP